MVSVTQPEKLLTLVKFNYMSDLHVIHWCVCCIRWSMFNFKDSLPNLSGKTVPNSQMY